MAQTFGFAADTALSVVVLDAVALLGAAAAVVLVVALAAYRFGQRHREAQARRLRERLAGRLNSGAP